MKVHNPQPIDAALLDYPAAQTYLGGVSRSTLKTLVGKGELFIVNIGRRAFFRRHDLDKYIARRVQRDSSQSSRVGNAGSEAT